MCLVMCGVFFSSGYRIAQSGFGQAMRWDITRERPVIWVRVCPAVRQATFDYYQFPAGDPLEFSFPSTDAIITSVFEDFNQIESSFVQLRWYAEEASVSIDPPEVFTETSARHRTIDVCSNSTSYEAVAHAAPKNNDTVCEDIEFAQKNRSYCSENRVAACQVVLEPSYFTLSTDLFVHVLTHELAHCLGLMHNHETTDSVMSYLSERQQTVRLTLDDKLGITYLYPLNGDSVQESVNFGLTQCSSK